MLVTEIHRSSLRMPIAYSYLCQPSCSPSLPVCLLQFFASLRTTLLDWAEIAHSLNFALPQQVDWQPHPSYRRNDSATPLSLQPLAHSQNWHIQFVSANNPTSLVCESIGVPSTISQPIPNSRQAISWQDHQLPNSNSALCKIILMTTIHTGSVCKHQLRPRGAEHTRRSPPAWIPLIFGNVLSPCGLLPSPIPESTPIAHRSSKRESETFVDTCPTKTCFCLRPHPLIALCSVSPAHSCASQHSLSMLVELSASIHGQD